MLSGMAASPRRAGGQAIPFGRAVIIQGSEPLLVDRAVEERLAAAHASQPAVQVTHVEAASLDSARFAEITGASLFASHAVAVLRDVGGLDPELADPLVALASDCPPDVALVLVHPGGQKGKGLLDRLKKAGVEVVDAGSVRPWELAQFVAAEAKRAGGRIDPQAAQSLVDAIGHDLRSLSSAVTQLLGDSDDGLLTIGLLRQYFGGRAEVTSFAVADDALSGDTTAAIEKLRWALSTGVAPVLVTSALAAGLRNLSKYLDVRSGGMRDGDMARDIGVPPWKMRDLARQARGWSPAGLACGIRAVAAADGHIKGAASDAGFALERLLLALQDAREQRGRRLNRTQS